MQSTRAVFLFLTIPFGLICLAAGYCTGRFMSEQAVVVETTMMAPMAVSGVSSQDGDALLRLNRALAENERLKADLRLARMAPEEVEVPAVEMTATDTEEARPQFRSFREMSEDLKARDPEAYQQMVERRNRFREMMRETQNSRFDFLTSIDLSLLTEEEQETHRRYMDALARRVELEESFWERHERGDELTEAEREQMREVSMEVRTLQEGERRALLNAVGTVWNVPEEELEAFVETIESVNQAMSGGMMFGGGRGQRGGRPREN